MDLGAPLTTLFGRIDGVVLTVLARSNAMLNGRQVHRLLSGSASPSGVNAALRRLSAGGLVTASSRQAETLYRANRDHLLWTSVESALGSGEELRRRLRRTVETAGPSGTALVLYGSVSRGDATADSDIDLLLVFPDSVPPIQRDELVDELARQVTRWTGNDAQIIQLDRSSLRESTGREDALVDLWITEGELLIGDLEVSG